VRASRSSLLLWVRVGVGRGKGSLTGLRPVTMGPGVAPAIEESAPLAPATAGVPPGLFRGRAVVDDPDLAEMRAAHDDLVELGVVGHRVDVHPVRFLPRATLLVPLRRVLGLATRGGRRRRRWRRILVLALHVVDVDPLRVLGDLAVIGLRPVAVLDEMVPAPPFPDDLSGRLARGLDLDEAIG